MFSVGHDSLKSGRCCSEVQLLFEAQTGFDASFQPGWMGTVGSEKEPSIHCTQGVLHQNNPAFACQPGWLWGETAGIWFISDAAWMQIKEFLKLWPLRICSKILKIAAKKRKRLQLFSWRGFALSPNNMSNGNPVVHEGFLKISEKFLLKFAQVGWTSLLHSAKVLKKQHLFVRSIPRLRKPPDPTVIWKEIFTLA